MRDSAPVPAPQHSSGPRPIHYYKKNVYGNEMNYIHDDETADHVRKLTGQTTLSERHIEALKALGHDVKHVPRY